RGASASNLASSARSACATAAPAAKESFEWVDGICTQDRLNAGRASISSGNRARLKIPHSSELPLRLRGGHCAKISFSLPPVCMPEIAREIQAVNLEDEMRQSYLDYAMSVIVGRALPDVRDGLKPVHRRILHA